MNSKSGLVIDGVIDVPFEETLSEILVIDVYPDLVIK